MFGVNSGEELNYEAIASDSMVPARTVSNFVEILKDTLLAYELVPFRKTKKRKAIAKSKLYVFDVGVANYMASRRQLTLKSELFGKAFEHFILQETRAIMNYRLLDKTLYYWRAYSGHEVDCIIAPEMAIEIKATSRVREKHIKNLLALKEEGLVKEYIVVSLDKEPRIVQGVKIMPWNRFLEYLWKYNF